jgi:transcriptional regulator with XRE-family HTH domain
MARRRRSSSEVAGAVEAGRVAATLAGELRQTRRRRRVTQRELGRRAGLDQTRISQIERGRGGSLPLEKWIAIGIALGRPFAAGFSRDIGPPAPADAGHLEAQELILRLARAHGRVGLFELPSRPSDPSRSTDVGIRDDANRTLILVEIWNRLDDIGRAARASDRKLAEAADVAGFRDPAYRVAACWLLVDTAANRGLVRRFPEILRARFPGSSPAWVRALALGGPAPARSGLCWIDPRSGRLTALRLRG